MPRVPLRRAVPLFATIAAAALLAAGCANPYSGDLLLADAPDPSGQVPDVDIWAVEPGEDADDTTLVAAGALSPLEIATKAGHGQVWVNSLGRIWDGSVLLAYGVDGAGVVSSGQPGAEPTELARSPRIDTTVLRRGAYLQTSEGCLLAAGADDVERVGEGSCTISTDERWVASWPATGEGLTIRDLRDGSIEQVPDLVVGNAVALGRDARVLVIARVDDGFQAVVVDATDGSEVGRTETYQFLDVAELDDHAEGFVLQASDGEAGALLYVDTDATVTTIDQGFFLVPVTNGAAVTYLNYGETLVDSSLRRWSRGEEPEELLTGFVGAGSPDGEHVIASRETTEGTELWREHSGTGELRLALTLERAEGDSDPSGGDATSVGVGVPQMQVDGSTVHLQVDGTATSSYVRIDMDGDSSDVPVPAAPGLLFEALDTDGTALLTRASGDATTAAATEDILIVRPKDEEAELRTTVGRTATNLLHDGVIYLTETSDPSAVKVLSLRATGSDDEVRELYSGKQLAGATWPQWGGATRALFITPRLLIEQAQQAQQQNVGQAGAPTQP